MDKHTVTVQKSPGTITIEQPSTTKPTHRYVCEACSGVAFYGSVGDEVKKTPSTCQTCFAPLGKVKLENFIKL